MISASNQIIPNNIIIGPIITEGFEPIAKPPSPGATSVDEPESNNQTPKVIIKPPRINEIIFFVYRFFSLLVFSSRGLKHSIMGLRLAFQLGYNDAKMQEIPPWVRV